MPKEYKDIIDILDKELTKFTELIDDTYNVWYSQDCVDENQRRIFYDEPAYQIKSDNRVWVEKRIETRAEVLLWIKSRYLEKLAWEKTIYFELVEALDDEIG